MLKRGELPDHEKAQRKLQCTVLSGKYQFSKSTFRMFPTIWERQNHEDSKKDQWFPEAEGGEG